MRPPRADDPGTRLMAVRSWSHPHGHLGRAFAAYHTNSVTISVRTPVEFTDAYLILLPYLARPEYGYSVCSDGPIPVIRWRPGCAT